MARISVRNKDTEQQVTQQVPSVFGCCAGSKTVLPPSWPPWHSDWKMTTFKKKIVCLLCRPLTLGPFSRLRIINLAPNTIGVTGVTKASDFGHSSCLESLKSRRLEWLGSTNFCRWHCGRRSCSGGWCHTISRHHHSLPNCQNASIFSIGRTRQPNAKALFKFPDRWHTSTATNNCSAVPTEVRNS